MEGEASQLAIVNDSSNFEFPFQSDYDLSLQIKGPKYYVGVLVDKSLTTKERKKLNIKYAEFTVGGLKKLLQIDDPEGYAVLNSELSAIQWNQLLLSIEMGSSASRYIYHGLLRYLFEIANEGNEETNRLALKLHHVASDLWDLACSPVFHRWIDDEVAYFITAKSLIRGLYCANEVVETLSIFCESTNDYLNSLSGSLRNEISRTYEALRPGADLWRTIPNAAITPFITINEVKAIEPLNLQLLLDLDKLVSSHGSEMDDNSARRNEAVAAWWKWTDSWFEYQVHYGVSIFDTQDVVKEYIKHLDKACIAFDPTNETNIKVLDLLDKGFYDVCKQNKKLLKRTKKYFNATDKTNETGINVVDELNDSGSTFCDSVKVPIIKDIKVVHEKLLLLKSLVEKTLLSNTNLVPDYGNKGPFSKRLKEWTTTKR